jgi:hypothetical protein
MKKKQADIANWLYRPLVLKLHYLEIISRSLLSGVSKGTAYDFRVAVFVNIVVKI